MTASDPGPVPDILKREPPKSPEPTKPLDLSTTELIKAINDDYSFILNSERANLPRALVIAEKLNALRARAYRGQWKTKFAEHGLNISYETASVYLRIWEHWPEIQELAAEKGVDPTLLTIDAARELWAKRSDSADSESESESDSDDGAGDGKPTAEAMEAMQAANAEAEAAELAKKHIMDMPIRSLINLEPEDMFAMLMQVYPQDGLRDLTEMLAKHFGMTLMPLATTEALMRELGTPTDVSAPVA